MSYACVTHRAASRIQAEGWMHRGGQEPWATLRPSARHFSVNPRSSLVHVRFAAVDIRTFICITVALDLCAESRYTYLDKLEEAFAVQSGTLGVVHSGGSGGVGGGRGSCASCTVFGGLMKKGANERKVTEKEKVVSKDSLSRKFCLMVNRLLSSFMVDLDSRRDITIETKK